MIVLDVLAGVLVLAGAALAVIAAIGVHRLPDVYGRMHAAAKPATLGVALCLLAAALRVDDVTTVTKLLLAIAFQFLTAPVAGHLISRAAHQAGAAQSEHTIRDDLADDTP